MALPISLPLAAVAAVQPVTTSIVVNAAPEVVWRHVIFFPELPAPRETIFRAGVASPVGARIDGHGVGARSGAVASRPVTSSSR
jgi:hypothetical protein